MGKKPGAVVAPQKNGILPGLELARQYYETEGLPMLRRQFPALVDKLAVGRVGEGSECFGFDDALSRDHDFGPGFCLWLDESLWSAWGAALTSAYWRLPAEFAGVKRPDSGPFRLRVGPFSIHRFYAGYLGGKGLPETPEQWFELPQEVLALCTNGAVFTDPQGSFTAARSHLLDYYPEPVRLKKLAAHCALAAQAGQYNYPRCVKRGEHCAALWALSQFQYHFTAALFLLNRRYMPFGKWAFRAARNLPLLGSITTVLLEPLSPGEPQTEACIERLCILLSQQLCREGLSDSSDSFLAAHGRSVQERITHPGFAALPLQAWRPGWQI